MKKNHTELVCIIDRSGSMSSIAKDAIGGYNSFIEEQKKLPGTASVTLVLFDHEYQMIYDNVDIQNVELLDKNYTPRGMTALLDAVGRTINSVGERLAKTNEEDRPEKVMVTILTDGMENSSSEFNKDKIKEMIEHQKEKYNWEFAFLAANQDAFSEAGSLGIGSQYTCNFCSTSDGTKNAFGNMTKYTTSYRSGQ